MCLQNPSDERLTCTDETPTNFASHKISVQMCERRHCYCEPFDSRGFVGRLPEVGQVHPQQSYSMNQRLDHDNNNNNIGRMHCESMFHSMRIYNLARTCC